MLRRRAGHRDADPAGLSLRSRVLAAALVAVATAMVGCGGEPDPPAAADRSGPTVSEYLARADTICLRSRVQIEQRGARFLRGLGDKPLSDAALAEFAEATVIPVAEQRLETLRALPRPEGDERELAAIFAAGERALDRIRRDPGSLREPERAFAEEQRLARQYGFVDCGSIQ